VAITDVVTGVQANASGASVAIAKPHGSAAIIAGLASNSRLSCLIVN